MDLKKTFATDPELELEGVWYPLDDTTSIKVARDGNKNHVKALKRLTKPYRVQISTNTMHPDLVKKINATAMAETILLDWKGLEDDDKLVEYSTESAAAMLIKYPDFFKTVSAISEDMSVFQRDADAAAAKN